MAELELISDKRQRLAILRKRIDSLRTLEHEAIAKIKAGRASGDQKLLPMANRIQAEIDYVREESEAD